MTFYVPSRVRVCMCCQVHKAAYVLLWSCIPLCLTTAYVGQSLLYVCWHAQYVNVISNAGLDVNRAAVLPSLAEACTPALTGVNSLLQSCC